MNSLFTIMHPAWLLFLSSIAVQAMPLDARTNDVEEFPWKDEFDACEQAVNCHIVIDEDGDRMIDFIPGMEPGSEAYNAILNGTQNEPTVELSTRGYHHGKFSSNGKEYTARGITGHKFVEFGCKKKGDIHPAKRLRHALEARCPQNDGQCYPGPWSKAIHYMSPSSSQPAQFTWQVKAGGNFFPHEAGYYYDVIEGMARHTAQNWGTLTWSAPLEDKYGACERIEGSNYYAISRWHTRSGLMAGKMHAKVSIPELGQGSGFCSAAAGAMSSMGGFMSATYGDGISSFFGALSFVCNRFGQ